MISRPEDVVDYVRGEIGFKNITPELALALQGLAVIPL